MIKQRRNTVIISPSHTAARGGGEKKRERERETSCVFFFFFSFWMHWINYSAGSKLHFIGFIHLISQSVFNCHCRNNNINWFGSTKSHLRDKKKQKKTKKKQKERKKTKMSLWKYSVGTFGDLFAPLAFFLMWKASHLITFTTCLRTRSSLKPRSCNKGHLTLVWKYSDVIRHRLR